MMKPPYDISVIMPAYNAEAFLAQAIDCVLAQTVAPRELLVVDNASTDRTPEIIASYGSPVKALFNAKPGDAATRNVACRAAQGTWLAFLDADDLWSPNTLELFAAAVEEHPGVEMVCGHTVNFKEGAAIAGGYPPGQSRPAELPGASLIRREAFERVGPFNENYTLGTVVEWCARAKENQLRIQHLPQVVLHRRIHETNLSKRSADKEHNFVQILKESLDRRRAGKKA